LLLYKHKQALLSPTLINSLTYNSPCLNPQVTFARKLLGYWLIKIELVSPSYDYILEKWQLILCLPKKYIMLAKLIL
jgi:hypothetical protein